MVYSLVSLGYEMKLDNPAKVADYLRSAFEVNPMQEAFYCVYLDRKIHPLDRQLITLGTATSTLVSPKEVSRGPILLGATAIVVAHNHQSGDPAPSQADITVTRGLRETAKILEIELLHHVIVGDVKRDPHGCGYFSFKGPVTYEALPALLSASAGSFSALKPKTISLFYCKIN